MRCGFSGKIDRIDRTADGHFVVFDYKTGRMPSIADIDTGLNLQLPTLLTRRLNPCSKKSNCTKELGQRT